MDARNAGCNTLNFSWTPVEISDEISDARGMERLARPIGHEHVARVTRFAGAFSAREPGAPFVDASLVGVFADLAE